MKLTHFVVSAILALGVAAVPNPEAGEDVEVRDFSGESLTEFDARSPEEEEFETRDEEDLDVRTYTKRCKGDNVKLTKVGYEWKCVCKRTGEVYNEHKGCRCPSGQEYSKHWKKCIPDCDHDEEYNGHECVPKCKGKNVELKADAYGKKQCTCKLEHQEYDEHKGCRCVEGYTFSWKEHKCIKDCEHGEKYSKEHGCYKPCVGKNVDETWEGYPAKLVCKCEKRGQTYDVAKGGCHYSCPEGSTYSHEKRGCVCKDEQKELKNNVCVPRCKGENVFYKHGKCYCKNRGDYYNKHEGCKPRCPAGTTYDWGKKQCKCDKYGDVYDKEHKKCYTPCKGRHVELKWNGYTPTCECKKEGYEYTKHGCQPVCIKPAYFSHHKKACVCKKDDQKYVEHKGCVDRCGRNEEWNGHECVCDYGFYKYKGKCTKPPTCKGHGSYFDKKKWECRCHSKHYEYSPHEGCKKRSYGGY